MLHRSEYAFIPDHKQHLRSKEVALKWQKLFVHLEFKKHLTIQILQRLKMKNAPQKVEYY